MNPHVHDIITNPEKELSFRSIMDHSHVLLVNLAKGQVGEDTAKFLGGLLLGSLVGAAFSRIDIPKEKRTPFICYLDECSNFLTDSIGNMASELRKFGFSCVYATQYTNQLKPSIRDAILGNVGTIISYRTNWDDAKLLTKYFHPVFQSEDFLNLKNHNFYIKMMIDGKPVQAFSAQGLLKPP